MPQNPAESENPDLIPRCLECGELARGTLEVVQGVALAYGEREVYRRWRDDAYRNRSSEGESMFTVRSRVFEALGDWAAQAVKQRMDLVVITYYFPFIAIHDVLAPTARKPCNCSLSRFELRSGRLQPDYLAKDNYLGERRSEPVKWPSA